MPKSWLFCLDPLLIVSYAMHRVASLIRDSFVHLRCPACWTLLNFWRCRKKWLIATTCVFSITRREWGLADKMQIKDVSFVEREPESLWTVGDAALQKTDAFCRQKANKTCDRTDLRKVCWKLGILGRGMWRPANFAENFSFETWLLATFVLAQTWVERGSLLSNLFWDSTKFRKWRCFWKIYRTFVLNSRAL